MEYASIFSEAKAAAVAATKALEAKIGDAGAAGFAWVQIKSSDHVAHILASGLAEKGDEAFMAPAFVFEPGEAGVQSLSVREAGAEAFAAVLKSHGIDCRSWSRVD